MPKTYSRVQVEPETRATIAECAARLGLNNIDVYRGLAAALLRGIQAGEVTGSEFRVTDQPAKEAK